MAVEEIGRLRTIAIVGQGGTGKTQLAEAMLFTAGVITRLGRPDDGTAAMDFEAEELHRHVSISSSFHHLDWKKVEIIIADTPGYSAFLPDCLATLRAIDGVVFVASPGSDLKVESEKIWQALSELGLPRIAFVSRLDRERTSFENALADLEKTLGAKTAALTLPIGEETALSGIIDVLAMKALVYSDTSGKPKEEALGGAAKERAEQARTKLCETVAETEDELLEKYLDKGTLEDNELHAALRSAVLTGKIVPVLCGSGARNIGIGPMLDAIVNFLPAPNERPAVQGFALSNGEPAVRRPDPNEPFAAFVFKTVIDPFVGKLSIFRVLSGKAQSDANAFNASHQTKERLGQLLRLEGKKQSPLAMAIAGEIAAVAKLKDTVTS
ncbi:MAG: GTP-binding protein, partial [Bradyrhizobium sp.]